MTDLIQQKRAFAGWPMLVAWLAMLLFALHASTHMVGAGDTWVAMACGRHFINHGADTNEPFSANSHRQGPTPEEVKTWPKWAQSITDKVGLDTVKYWHPTGWVNQNWLTHTIFYWLVHYSPFADDADWSFNALVYWKFTIYILTVICVYYTSRVLGVNPALAAVFACASMFIGRSLLDIRPAGFSNLLVAVFLLILVLATYRNYLYIWLLVPVTAFWSNLHGGYIYVFIMLAPVVVLRLLTILSKRATVSLHCILTWLALFAAMYKYTSHEPFIAAAPLNGKFFFLLVLLIIASIVLTRYKSVNAAGFYGYHIIASLIVFAVLLARFFPPEQATWSQELAVYAGESRLSFFMAFVAASALGLVVTLLKDRLVTVSPTAVAHTTAGQTTAVAQPAAGQTTAVAHTAAAGLAAFVASIIFNPFHLTNLTHTFVISISQHAEGWRNVHEWWPSFRWGNPVGTAFPFMIMLVLGVGLLGLWLFSRLLVPKQAKMTKLELERQERRNDILMRILGYASAVVVIWAVIISFSLGEVSFSGFLLTGLFVGILWASVQISVHFIYLIVPLSVFALQTADAGHGYLGRYIFPFITIPIYAAMFGIGSQISSKPKYKVESIFFVLGGAVAAMILSAWIVNPFKFKESVWHLEQFWGIRRLWQPVYEANLELTYKNLFGVLYGISGLCIILWLVVPLVRDLFRQNEVEIKTKGQAEAGEGYQLPRIDLALITIAVLTAYMAIRSRRFITIAGYASCPVLAMFTEQIICAAGASWNFYKHGRLDVPRIPRWVQRFLVSTAIIVVAGLGIYWGHKFKVVYLDRWPNDTKLTSMFIRMTASHAKPFYACGFIKQNKMSGKMFNYWTEGGFIAWGQEPDPNTGRTPLQLFMDGRAQAAYDYKAYLNWAEISSGGPIVQRARIRNQNLTAEDYLQVGQWIENELKNNNVWVVLMPSNQFDTAFVTGLEHSRNWRVVFMNDKQKLYVDITDPRGLKIFNGIMDGTTVYPNDYSRNIIIAHTILVFEQAPERVATGLDCAIKALEEDSTRLPAQLIQIYYQQYPALRTQIMAFWKRYLDDFLANEEKYLNSDGYLNRATIALTALAYITPMAEKAKETEVVQQYQQKEKELREVLYTINDKRW
ncbi:MAG: hypothetical protein ABII09_03390 [Planctomycetota bacterium]